MDRQGHDKIMELAHKTLHLIEQEKWLEADEVETNQTTLIGEETHDVDFYNILKYYEDTGEHITY